jgi:hypothetical protein
MKRILFSLLLLLSISSFSQDTLSHDVKGLGIFNLPKLPKFLNGKPAALIDKSIDKSIDLKSTKDSLCVDTTSAPSNTTTNNTNTTTVKVTHDTKKIIKDSLGSVSVYIYGGSNIQLNFAPDGSITINENGNSDDDVTSSNKSKKKKGFLSNVDPSKAVAIITLLLATIPIILASIK